jgi:hypothetical protein
MSDRERISAWADLVYLRRGGVVHVLVFGSYKPDVSYPPALCGRSPELFESWLGTGNQTEIDKASQLPLCIRCLDLSKGRLR